MTELPGGWHRFAAGGRGFSSPQSAQTIWETISANFWKLKNHACHHLPMCDLRHCILDAIPSGGMQNEKCLQCIPSRGFCRGCSSTRDRRARHPSCQRISATFCIFMLMSYKGLSSFRPSDRALLLFLITILLLPF